MNYIEAMKQALDALLNYPMTEGKTITALRQAIEQAEKQFNPDWDQQAVLVERIRELEAELAKPEQEPVAWDGNCVLGHCGCPDGCDRSGCCRANLAPRKEWVGLTEDDVDWILGLAYAHDTELVKTVEAKLKDKNG